MSAPTQAPPGASHAANAAPPPEPYPFPVGVYESTIQDYDNTFNLGATIAAWQNNTQVNPKWSISPSGWLRCLWVDVTVTIAGNAATPTMAADGPWSFFKSVTFYDLGQQAVIQVSGYELMVLNKFGGYYDIDDPRGDITYSVTTGAGASAGSFHFILTVPLEIVSRDALGTVQNESKPGWSLDMYYDGPANVYGTQPTATGTASARIRGFIDTYTEPIMESPGGRPFSQTPPLPGTLQYWKSENGAKNAGNFQYDISNGLGFPIRNIIPYVRDAGNGTRASADANWPDPCQFNLGNVVLFNQSKNKWLSRLGKVFTLDNVTADTYRGRENGVFPIAYTQDFYGGAGSELRFKYLDTQVNSLLRFSGSLGGAVTFLALVNWVSTPSKNRWQLIAGSGG